MRELLVRSARLRSFAEALEVLFVLLALHLRKGILELLVPLKFSANQRLLVAFQGVNLSSELLDLRLMHAHLS
jgi:hypothetical protein